MSEIHSFSFSPEGIEKIRSHKYGSDWPVVYLIENGKELYVGESIRAYARTHQHLENPVRRRLKSIHILADDEMNKSAALDIESSLIEYMAADGLYTLQNGNGGLQDHNYYDRERYTAKFETIWKTLQEKKLAKNDLLQIRNSDLFKYSPYKTLTDDQYLIATKLLELISKNEKNTYLIHGGPGTGKTILATYLMKRLVQEGEQNAGLVIAMTSLRKTLQKVFRNVPGLKPSMVIGPGDVVKKKYNVLIVDEAHRLRQRRNIPNYGMFDKTNKHLGFDKNADELDWVLHSANQVILFYDEKQSVRPSDISPGRVAAHATQEFKLKQQIRVKGGEAYLELIDSLLEGKKAKRPKLNEYDFQLYDDISQMVRDIKSREKEHSLARLVAGYAWEWKSRTDASKHDIEIGKERLTWNTQLSDWVNSPNAINEVGCIHTIQGYDLNYAGVIIGPELKYDPAAKELVVDRTEYKDSNGHKGVHDPEELKRYIINIYKTLLTRGILGTYVYAVDENLRSYLKQSLGYVSNPPEIKSEPIISPYSEQLVSLPLYDSIGCGEATYADPNAVEQIEVPASLVRPGAKYFVLRTSGDSMNELGIEDGDLILCQKNYQATSGSIAVVLIGDDATLKEIKYERDGLLLIPRSTNPRHQPYKLGEGDEFKVLGTFVIKLDIDL
jgi:DUF2075 family protein/DNA replication protein DnaC